MLTLLKAILGLQDDNPVWKLQRRSRRVHPAIVLPMGVACALAGPACYYLLVRAGYNLPEAAAVTLILGPFAFPPAVAAAVAWAHARRDRATGAWEELSLTQLPAGALLAPRMMVPMQLAMACAGLLAAGYCVTDGWLAINGAEEHLGFCAVFASFGAGAAAFALPAGLMGLAFGLKHRSRRALLPAALAPLCILYRLVPLHDTGDPFAVACVFSWFGAASLAMGSLIWLSLVRTASQPAQ